MFEERLTDTRSREGGTLGHIFPLIASTLAEDRRKFGGIRLDKGVGEILEQWPGQKYQFSNLVIILFIGGTADYSLEVNSVRRPLLSHSYAVVQVPTKIQIVRPVAPDAVIHFRTGLFIKGTQAWDIFEFFFYLNQILICPWWIFKKNFA